jgi:hypothetical protein
MAYQSRPIINGIYQGTDWAPNSNTRAYWKLNGDLLDYSGNNKHLNNTPLSGSTPGQLTSSIFGNGHYFNGTTDLLWNNDWVITGLTTFTISCWLYGPASAGMFFQLGTTDAGIALGRSGANLSGLSMQKGWLNDFAIDALTNTWAHVAMTRGSGTITGYVNGVAGGTTFATDVLNPIEGYVVLGGTYGTNIGWTFYPTHRITEAFVEDVCWTAGDVLAYYNKYKY